MVGRIRRVAIAVEVVDRPAHGAEGDEVADQFGTETFASLAFPADEHLIFLRPGLATGRHGSKRAELPPVQPGNRPLPVRSGPAHPRRTRRQRRVATGPQVGDAVGAHLELSRDVGAVVVGGGAQVLGPNGYERERARLPVRQRFAGRQQRGAGDRTGDDDVRLAQPQGEVGGDSGHHVG